jgi:glutamyl-tRNA reductase
MESHAASTRTEPLKRLRAHGDSARADVLAKAQQQLAAGQDPHAVLDFLAHTLTNRLLHAPTVALRQAALEGDADLARAANKLFPATGIEPDASGGNPEAEN